MDDTTTIVIIISIGIIVAISVGWFGFRSKEGRILDKYLTIDRILNELNEFRMKANPKRKDGFTEKDVQDELEKFFNKHFETVHREYALEGSSVKKIDFDLGDGNIGIEVKLAREILKEGEWDRAIGQINKYIKKKYGDGKLIVLVAGYEDEKDKSRLREFEADVENQDAIFTFFKIKKYKQKKK